MDETNMIETPIKYTTYTHRRSRRYNPSPFCADPTLAPILRGEASPPAESFPVPPLAE